MHPNTDPTAHTVCAKHTTHAVLPTSSSNNPTFPIYRDTLSANEKSKDTRLTPATGPTTHQYLSHTNHHPPSNVV